MIKTRFISVHVSIHAIHAVNVSIAAKILSHSGPILKGQHKDPKM